MERPMHWDSRAASVSPSRMMFAVGLAILLEAGAIYVVGSGLGARVMSQLPGPLKIDILRTRPGVIPLPPPTTQLIKPSLPTVSRPVIDIQPPPTSQTPAVQSAQPASDRPTVIITPQEASPEPTPVRGIAETHTQPPYPVLARRIGKEGTVVLNITVGVDGSVQDVSIAKSSGDNDLDETALSWVKAHWRYRPAIQSGHAIVAQSEAEVVFNLK